MKNTSVLLCLLVAFVSASAVAGPVVNGKEWLQPADVTGFSWSEFNAVCAGGSCIGSIGTSGPDLTGWTWASIFEVGDLFSVTTPHSGGVSVFESAQISFGAEFITDVGFQITSSPEVAINFGVSAVAGHSSTLMPTASSAYLGFVQIGFFPQYFRGSLVSTDTVNPTDYRDDSVGAWLYRSVSIPSPASLSLLLLACAQLFALRIRRARIERV